MHSNRFHAVASRLNIPKAGSLPVDPEIVELNDKFTVLQAIANNGQLPLNEFLKKIAKFKNQFVPVFKKNQHSMTLQHIFFFCQQFVRDKSIFESFIQVKTTNQNHAEYEKRYTEHQLQKTKDCLADNNTLLEKIEFRLNYPEFNRDKNPWHWLIKYCETFNNTLQMGITFLLTIEKQPDLVTVLNLQLTIQRLYLACLLVLLQEKVPSDAKKHSMITGNNLAASIESILRDHIAYIATLTDTLYTTIKHFIVLHPEQKPVLDQQIRNLKKKVYSDTLYQQALLPHLQRSYSHFNLRLKLNTIVEDSAAEVSVNNRQPKPSVSLVK